MLIASNFQRSYGSRHSKRREAQKFYYALEDIRDKAMFLLYATTGLRRSKLRNLRKEDIDFYKRMIIPRKNSKTKNTWVTFYSEEAEKVLREYSEQEETAILSYFR